MTIVPNQMVKVKWVGANRKQLESHGYVYTKQYEEIEIPIEHLSEKSHVKVKIICDWCNKEKSKRRTDIKLEGNHFCNSTCYRRWLSNSETGKKISDNRKTSIKTNCKECESEIYKIPSEFNGHGEHYCSRSCMAKHRMRNKNPNPKKDKTKVYCSQCSCKLDVHESKAKKNKWNFCTRECYAKFRSENIKGEKIHNFQGLTVKCNNCNHEIKTTKYHQEKNKNLFCSQECYYEYRSKFYTGENHPQYGVPKSPEQIDQMRIITANRIANGDFPQTNTSIQLKTGTIIKELDFDFLEEIPFKYYVLDFYSPSLNLAIEVMGDYWHANPMKYANYDDLHDIQKKDIKRDKSKNTYLKKYHAINVLYLWEKDINEHPEMCKELISLYVKNSGILEDYNSYNYSLRYKNLSLNKEIIKPYFLRANTIHQTCGHLT